MPAGVQIARSAEAMIAEARRRTGIDLVDEAAVEPLGALLRALNAESGLHAAGAAAMEARLLHMLDNRLRMQRDFLAHPEIAEQEVAPPIFICGMGRTGSTKLQKLLAASQDFNWLCFWKVYSPSLLTGRRDEPLDKRIADAAAYLEWFDAASPETKYAHFFELHDPEEESWLLEHSFVTPVGLGWSPIGAYLEWLMRQDLTGQFAFLRDMLKYLQWQGLAEPGRRWILKSPLYPGLEPFLLKIFPDASLVMTHRHPKECVASAMRLLELFYMPFTEAPIDPVGYVEGQAAAIDTHLDNRASMADLDILDIHFEEVVHAPVRAIEKIYAANRLRLGDAARARICAWNDTNPAHQKGRHRYSLADYGLTEGYIETRFARYIDLLRRVFPATAS